MQVRVSVTKNWVIFVIQFKRREQVRHGYFVMIWPIHDKTNKGKLIFYITERKQTWLTLFTKPYVSIFFYVQYIPRNMHTVFALLCFVVVIHWLIFPYPSGLLHWHCGNLTIAPVPAKQPWWIWINTSCEFIMNDCITTTKQSTTKPCAYSWDILYFTCSVDSVTYFTWNKRSQSQHVNILGPLLLTWFNFNPSMDK